MAAQASLNDPDQVVWAANAWDVDGTIRQWAGYARGALCSMVTLRGDPDVDAGWQVRIFGLFVGTYDEEDDAKASVRWSLWRIGPVAEFFIWLRSAGSPPVLQAVQQVG